MERNKGRVSKMSDERKKGQEKMKGIDEEVQNSGERDAKSERFKSGQSGSSSL